MFKFLCVMIRRPTRSTRTYTLSPDTTLFRYSGPDEPGDGLRVFLDLGLRRGAAHSGSPDDAVAQVLLEQTEGDRAQRLGHRGDLGEDVDAILLLLDHPLKASCLPLDPAQSLEVVLLVPDVAVARGLVLVAHACFPFSERSIARYIRRASFWERVCT